MKTLLSFLVFGLAMTTGRAHADGGAPASLTGLMSEIEQLRGEVHRLNYRVGALESCRTSSDAPTVEAAPAPALPCLRLDADIPFRATGFYFDWANIVAGRIPGDVRSEVGAVTLGGPGNGGPYQRSGVDGTLSMTILPSGDRAESPYPGYPAGTSPRPSAYPTSGDVTPQTASGEGFLRLSPLTLQDLRMRFGDNACVSGLAMNGGHYYTTIYGATIYIYLNGEQHGYSLYF